MQEPLNIDLDTTGGAREGGVVGKPEEVESTLINTEPLPDEVDKVQCSPPTGQLVMYRIIYVELNRTYVYI